MAGMGTVIPNEFRVGDAVVHRQFRRCVSDAVARFVIDEEVRERGISCPAGRHNLAQLPQFLGADAVELQALRHPDDAGIGQINGIFGVLR